ncbi:MAG: DUF5615 family PIN-like protein, partial [Bacteroidota bacterium]|nr:DUF5615 family PIN-like protein [Bacteroidota bacterium]
TKYLSGSSMKLLFDQNISYRILKNLPEIYSGSSHIIAEGLINAPDFTIWEYAKLHQFMIVTQDSDFNDIYLLKGFPPKIFKVRKVEVINPPITTVASGR